MRVEVEAGKERFVRVSVLDGAWVESPKVARVEALESGEVLLTGVTPGRTRVLLSAEGKMAVWAVEVGGASKVPRPATADSTTGALEEARKRCKGLEAGPSSLVATVPDEPCRRALKTLLEGDRYLAREVTLTFEVPALQAQLRDIEAGLREAGLGEVKARYLGAGLVLEGALSESAHVRALWVVFERSVGRVALDDRTQREAPVDAGAVKVP